MFNYWCIYRMALYRKFCENVNLSMLRDSQIIHVLQLESESLITEQICDCADSIRLNRNSDSVYTYTGVY